jgi:hypothetical protein
VKRLRDFQCLNFPCRPFVVFSLPTPIPHRGHAVWMVPTSELEIRYGAPSHQAHKMLHAYLGSRIQRQAHSPLARYYSCR